MFWTGFTAFLIDSDRISTVSSPLQFSSASSASSECKLGIDSRPVVATLRLDGPSPHLLSREQLRPLQGSPRTHAASTSDSLRSNLMRLQGGDVGDHFSRFEYIPVIPSNLKKSHSGMERFPLGDARWIVAPRHINTGAKSA